MSQSRSRADNDDMDDDDDEFENGIWMLNEELVPAKKSGDPAIVQRFWTMAPGLIASIQEKPEIFRHAVFYMGTEDPPKVGAKRGLQNITYDQTKVFFILWSTYARYRCLPGNATAPNLSVENRVLSGYDYDGKFIPNILSSPTTANIASLPTSSVWPNDPEAIQTDFSTFFDNAFSLGQKWSSAIAEDLKQRKPVRWVVVTDLTWQESTKAGGKYIGPPNASLQKLSQPRSSNDTRAFTTRSDGIAFQYVADALPIASANDQYVRLGRSRMGKRESAAGDCLTYDGQARDRGLTKRDMFVPRSTMDKLRSGTFDWSLSNRIFIRDRQGSSNFIRVPAVAGVQTRSKSQGSSSSSSSSPYRSQSYWSTAWTAAVTSIDGKSIRSRNIGGLKLLLVVPEHGSRTSKTELQGLVDTVIAAAIARIPIKQTAQVCDQKEHIGQLKTDYNYLLGISPFGDYQTWISLSSLISYVESYPGRDLPKDENTAATAFKNLIPKGNALKAGTLKQLDKLKAVAVQKTGDKGAMTTSVSTLTMTGAKAKDRSMASGQGAVMGGSATSVAQVFSWPYFDRTVGAVDALPIRWDNPGVYPAEWLHRCAWSWGFGQQPDANQRASNFVFGSSEANGLMTRFERAWQGLLRRHASYEVEVGIPVDTKVCSLTTINTSRQDPFTSIAVQSKGGVKTVQETSYQLMKGSGDFQKTIFELKPDGSLSTIETVGPIASTATTGFVNYWGWTEEHESLCFSLKYEISLPGPILNKPFGIMSTDFYPFRRGFFTRLEADIDQALLKTWYDAAVAAGLAQAQTQAGVGAPINNMVVVTSSNSKAQVQQMASLPVRGKDVKSTSQGFAGPSGHGPQSQGLPPQGPQPPGSWHVSGPPGQVNPGQGPPIQASPDHRQPGQWQPGHGGQPDHGQPDHSGWPNRGGPQDHGGQNPPGPNGTSQPDPSKTITPSQDKPIDISGIKVTLVGVDANTAAAWNAVAKSTPLQTSGIIISHPRIASKLDAQALVGLDVVTFGTTSTTKPSVVPAVTRRAVASGAAGPLGPKAVSASGAPAVSNVQTGALAPTVVVPEDFALTGPIKLFGLFDAQLFSFHGDKSSGIRQIVPLSTDQLKLSDLLSGFANTPLDDIQLSKTMFIYNQYTKDENKAGTWLSTEIIFKGALQPISAVMSSVFSLNNPSVRFDAFLTDGNDWSRPFFPHTIYLRGNIPGLSIQIGDLVEIKNLWIGINTGRRFDRYRPTEMGAFIWGFDFYGEARLAMPNSMTPLIMHFSVSTLNDNLHMQLDSTSDTVLTKFCGIDGIELSLLSLSTDIVTGKAPSLLLFTIDATIELNDSTLSLSGLYSKTSWFLACDLNDFDFDSLRDLYNSLFDDDLHMTDHEILINDLSLSLSTDGIVVEGEITIEGHKSVEASISITRMGFEITGGIEGGIVQFGDLTLESAKFDVFIGRASDTTATGSGTSWRLQILGQIKLYNTIISVTVILGKGQNGSSTWTIYGELNSDPRVATKLSTLVPADPPDVKTALAAVPWLDFDLQQVALVASNADGSAAGNPKIPAGYTVKTGIQILARLNGIDAFDKAMNNPASTGGMIVQIGYGTSFRVGIQLPAPQQASMKGDSIYSGPITLGIEFGGPEQIALMVSADFFYRVSPREPLRFTGGIKVGFRSASLSLNMGDGQIWQNPFNLCSRLSLGPRLGLQVELDYGPPLAVGGGIAASFQFDSNGDMFGGEGALSVSEIPSQELLLLSARNIGIIKMVTFAASVVGEPIPSPPEEFLVFKEIKIYLSTGAYIGQLYYPPGAQFTCDAVLFGVEVKVDCRVNKATKDMTISASLSSIILGPLSITGAQRGTDLQINIAISPGGQRVLFNGLVTLFDLEASVYVSAELLPSPKFDLHTLLRFTDALTFEVDATTQGAVMGSLNQMSNCDFNLHALMKQAILDFVRDKIDEQIKAAKHAADISIDDAKKKLEASQADYQRQVEAAQGTVGDAQKAFDSRLGDLRLALQQAQDAFTDGIKPFVKAWQDANQAFQDLCTGLSNTLQDITTKAAEAIRIATQAVNDARIAADAKVDEALRKLQEAQTSVDQQFGDADSKLRQAEDKVYDCQSSVDNAQREYDDAVNELNNCEFYEAVYYAGKVAGKGLVLGTMKAGLSAAKDSLRACHGVVDDVGYRAARGSIDTCQRAVDDARRAGDQAVERANSQLNSTTADWDGKTKDAQDALNKAKTSSQELATTQKAKDDLDRKVNELDANIAKAADDLTNIVHEAVSGALKAANDTLQVAKGATVFIHAAKDLLDGVEALNDKILDLAAWINDHLTSLLNIKQIEVTGNLTGICRRNEPLHLEFVGFVAGSYVDWNFDMRPGEGIDFIKSLYNKILQDVQGGVINVEHRPGWTPPVTRQDKITSALNKATPLLDQFFVELSAADTGANFVKRKYLLRSQAKISTFKSINTDFSDKELLNLETFDDSQAADQVDFERLVNSLPPAPNMSYADRSRALSLIDQLITLVGPDAPSRTTDGNGMVIEIRGGGPRPNPYGVDRLDTSHYDDWETARDRVSTYMNPGNGFTAPASELTIDNFATLDTWLDSYDGVHATNIDSIQRVIETLPVVKKPINIDWRKHGQE